MKNLFKENLYLKTFGLIKIPLIFYINPKIISLNDEEIKVAIALNRRTRNHYGSMYFGALAVGADISVGLFAMSLVRKSGANLQLLFKDFEIQFHKRAEDTTIFICHDHEKINNQIAAVMQQRKRVNEQVSGYAFVPSDGEKPVCSFKLTVSLKHKE